MGRKLTHQARIFSIGHTISNESSNHFLHYLFMTLDTMEFWWMSLNHDVSCFNSFKDLDFVLLVTECWFEIYKNGLVVSCMKQLDHDCISGCWLCRLLSGYLRDCCLVYAWMSQSVGFSRMSG